MTRDKLFLVVQNWANQKIEDDAKWRHASTSKPADQAQIDAYNHGIKQGMLNCLQTLINHGYINTKSN